MRTRDIFPLTTLQIGDIQSYLSRTFLYFATESDTFFILVDNSPWLTNKLSKSKHFWQYLVAKYRDSPFANTRERNDNNIETRCISSPDLTDVLEVKKSHSWSPVIDAAKWRNKALFPQMELRRTLHGFIVFEVSWKDVCGINYLNELQTDTSLALEVKCMKKWEFNTIDEASKSISSWFSGTEVESVSLASSLKLLASKGTCLCRYSFDAAQAPFFHLGSAAPLRDVPHDGYEQLVGTKPHNEICSEKHNQSDTLVEQKSSGCISYRQIGESKKQMNISPSRNSVLSSDICDMDLPKPNVTLGPTLYGNSLLQFRFSDHDLPFKLNQIITPNLKLLTLLELGLPSWVIFFQSYPGFIKLYRPWMKPLARTLYVLTSIVTVLVASYDLYNNVPVFRATTALLFKPIFDQIETWDMISRIKYVATMLFLRHLGKVIERLLSTVNSVRPLVSSLTRPFMELILEVLQLVLPVWSNFIGSLEAICSSIWMIVETAYMEVVEIFEFLIWPIQTFLSMIWTIATTFILPLFCSLWEILVTPIRLLVSMVHFTLMLFADLLKLLIDICQLYSSSASSVSEVKAAAAHEMSILSTLWKTIFAAVRSILNGLVAFLASCNRHRLSIYNHMQKFVRQLSRLLQLDPYTCHHQETSCGWCPEDHACRLKID